MFNKHKMLHMIDNILHFIFILSVLCAIVCVGICSYLTPSNLYPEVDCFCLRLIFLWGLIGISCIVLCNIIESARLY